MELRFEEQDGVLIVRMAGEELGADTADETRQMLLPRLASTPWVVLDLSSLTFMDSSGLGVLVAAMKSVRGRGEMRLIGAHERIRELFGLTGLGRVFAIEADLASALTALDVSRGRSRAA